MAMANSNSQPVKSHNIKYLIHIIALDSIVRTKQDCSVSLINTHAVVLDFTKRFQANILKFFEKNNMFTVMTHRTVSYYRRLVMFVPD